MAAAEVQGREAVPPLAPDELPEGTVPGTWGWQIPPSRGDIDAATARAVREQRVATRLDNLALWRAGLARLSHYDPDYEYDVVHEYEHDWTTDPDYGCDGIYLLDYDDDGFVSPEASRHLLLIAAIVHTLCDALGNRAVHEMEVHYLPELGEALGLLTGEGKGKSYVKPDLTVLPPEHALPPDWERGKWRRALNLELGDPIPELVVEIVSPTSERRDSADKVRLYAALGIAEYLVIEPGEPPDPAHDEPGRTPLISGCSLRVQTVPIDKRGIRRSLSVSAEYPCACGAGKQIKCLSSNGRMKNRASGAMPQATANDLVNGEESSVENNAAFAWARWRLLSSSWMRRCPTCSGKTATALKHFGSKEGCRRMWRNASWQYRKSPASGIPCYRTMRNWTTTTHQNPTAKPVPRHRVPFSHRRDRPSMVHSIDGRGSSLSLGRPAALCLGTRHRSGGQFQTGLRGGQYRVDFQHPLSQFLAFGNQGSSPATPPGRTGGIAEPID